MAHNGTECTMHVRPKVFKCSIFPHPSGAEQSGQARFIRLGFLAVF